MLNQRLHILLPQCNQRVLRALPPPVEALGTIPVRPIEELREVRQDVTPRDERVVLGVVVLRHYPLDAHEAPQPAAGHEVVKVRVEESTKHEHEPPYDVRVCDRPSIPFVVRRYRLEERTVQDYVLDVDIGGVGLVEGVHVRGMAEGLVGIRDLFGAHCEPVVTAVHPVGALVALVTGGEARPLNEHVLPAVVGAALGHDALHERGIVDVGGGGGRRTPTCVS